MTDQLTGTLENQGVDDKGPFVVIDGVRYTVPDYVLDWMEGHPLKNGEKVLYKRGLSKAGGPFLMKIMRAQEFGNIRYGVLLESGDTACKIRTNEKEIVYALKGRLPQVSLPQKIKFSVDKLGFITSFTFLGPAEPPTPEPEPVPEEKNPATAPTQDETQPCTSPAPMEVKAQWTITIGGTCNLGNYENLRFEIAGPATDREAMIQFLKDTASRFGQNNPAVKDLIEAWIRRILP